MSRKTFVLDTNVLLHDPECLLEFPENDVVIPVTVLEELDSKKRNRDEVGRNSRRVFRLLDSLSVSGTGNFYDGLQIQNGIKIRVTLDFKTDYKASFSLSLNDNMIIMSAYLIMERGERVVFVSKDLAARVKAEAVGLEVQDYEKLKVSFDRVRDGCVRIPVEKRDLDLFLKNGGIRFEDKELDPNQYLLMESEGGSQAIGRYDGASGTVLPLDRIQGDIWGIQPLNDEQRCAIDILMRPEVELGALIGPAGTGKTLLALAAGMRQVFDDGIYHKILVSRPIMPLGKDIGYLPGTKEEKLYHWMQPIYDNLEFLCESFDSDSPDTLNWVMDSKKIEMEAVTYIRGRSLPKLFIIIDEAQNLTPHEVKTVVSRAGKGTKVILAGDPSQIDNPYLDKNSNGLTYTIGCFRNQSLFGHVYLEKTERSPLAAIAAEVM